MKKTFVPLLLIALLFGTAAKSEAALITNGSFEDTNLNGATWGQFASINGWFLLPPPNDTPSPLFEIGLGGATGTGPYGVTNYDGTKVLELDSTANYTIYQDVTIAAGTYTLSFLAGLRTSDIASQNLFLTNGFSASFGNLWSLVNFVPTSSDMSVDLHSYAIDVTEAGTYRLSFTGTGTSDSLGTLLDRVSLDAAPNQVPDGGVTATLLGLALAGVGLVRRRMNS